MTTHEYIISSERALYRNDEYDCTFYSDEVYNAGDIIVLDGLRWIVEVVVE